MEIPEILKAFKYPVAPFPRKAVAAAREKREEITPYLLEIIDRVAKTPEEITKDERVPLAHIFALFLLAEFREARAYPKIVELVSLRPNEVDAILGDIPGECLDRILASICGGDVGPIG